MTTLYWITTSLISWFLLTSSYTYFFSAATIEGVKELGFPNFFRIQLGVMKFLAALCLLIPNVPHLLKEWSYAGTAFFLITALVAHIAHKDSVFISTLLVVLMLVLGLSYYSMLKIR